MSLEQITLEPATHASGTVHLPGSKSISNRALLLAALTPGITSLTGVLASDDTRVMIDALNQLGGGGHQGFRERLPNPWWNAF